LGSGGVLGGHQGAAADGDVKLLSMTESSKQKNSTH